MLDRGFESQEAATGNVLCLSEVSPDLLLCFGPTEVSHDSFHINPGPWTPP
jgi:hypothetical protein